MRIGMALMVLALGACEPPPELGAAGEPTLTILFPSKANTEPIDMELRDAGTAEERCVLPMLVVVDIDAFELIELGTVLEEVEGQGHWHFGIDGASNDVMADEAFLDTEFADVSASQTVLFEASLRSNLHQPLVQFEDFNDFVEVTVGSDCGT